MFMIPRQTAEETLMKEVCLMRQDHEDQRGPNPKFKNPGSFLRAHGIYFQEIFTGLHNCCDMYSLSCDT